MTVAQEFERVTRTVSVLDGLAEIEEAEPAIGQNPRARRRIEELRREQLASLPAIRISAAARLLGVTEPTARLWANEGLLKDVTRHPVRRVSAASVLRIRPIVRDLKRLGRNRNLLEAVFDRLDDELVLTDVGLEESLEQLRRGEIIDITPSG